MNSPDHPTISAKTGILLTNLGSPDAPTPKAVSRYLKDFLSDPRVVEIPQLIWKPLLHAVIAPRRSKKSAKLYQAIWTDEGSPLVSITKEQSAKLQALLHAEGYDAEVTFGMRYGKPSLQTALEELKQAGIQKIIVLPLYPQYCASTTASTFDEISRVFRQWRWLPKLHFINHYADHPNYIQALAESVQETIKTHGMPEKIAFSFHGVPARTLALGDPYSCYCRKTARLLAEKLQLSESQYTLCFQSRFGPATWLQPYTSRVLTDWASAGIKKIAVICPGFSADCLETLEEIDQQYRHAFLDAGGKEFHYIPALNANPSHINLLSALVRPLLLLPPTPPVSQ